MSASASIASSAPWQRLTPSSLRAQSSSAASGLQAATRRAPGVWRASCSAWRLPRRPRPAMPTLRILVLMWAASERDGLARGGALRRGIGQFLCQHAVLHRGLERLARLQAAEEVLDLQPVGGGVALQEEGLGLVGLDAARAPVLHLGGCVVATLQQAGRAQHLRSEER